MTNSASTSIRKAVAASLALGVLGSGLVLAPDALAQGGGGGVRTAGSCSAHGVWKLKAKPDDGRLEVEAEVDVNRAATHWKWTMSQNGKVVRSGTATTTAPSGSFSVNRSLTNRAGTDRIGFRAINTADGNTCSGALSS
jgi:hypothetical protein